MTGISKIINMIKISKRIDAIETTLILATTVKKRCFYSFFFSSIIILIKRYGIVTFTAILTVIDENT